MTSTSDNQAPLDNPVWASLTSRHRAFAVGAGEALRYQSTVNKFAAMRGADPACLRALADLVTAGEEMYLVQVAPFTPPPELEVLRRDVVVQMVWQETLLPALDDAEIIPLGEADSAEMVALTAMTQPGPFMADTWRLGTFYGVRRDGKLVAMAGTRFAFDGYCEISGVCTDPAFRGHGLAARLSLRVLHDILARGETPFLHSWKANQTAIDLYERLGFRFRTDVQVTVLTRRTPA